ncbi:hypothetical protein QL285_017272 [Trifolium repens]|jgi:hypothetical protein|nr:hypothetical protein QL285_017272 [Trifolium repens]
MTSFMVVLSKIMVVVMIAVAVLTSIQSSSMAQAQPLPGSIARSLLRDNVNYQGDKFDHQAQDLEDYAIWDPSPGYGRGGTGAPIPHPLEKSF